MIKIAWLKQWRWKTAELVAARPGPQRSPLPLPPVCAFIVSAQGAIYTPWAMKWGFLHQGKDFSVSSLDPRRKGRFDSVCIAGITAQLPISLLAPSRVPAGAARLSLTSPAHLFHTHITSLSLGESHPGAHWQVGSPRCCTREQWAPPAACSTTPSTTGSALTVLVQHSSPLKPPQMNQKHSEHEALSPGIPRAHCKVLILLLEKSGGTVPSCSLGTSVFGSCMGCSGQIPWGTGTSPCLCVCTASETWLAGHGRGRNFQSFPVLSHILSMGVSKPKKLSSLLCYFSFPVTQATVSKCSAHDILLLP